MDQMVIVPLLSRIFRTSRPCKFKTFCVMINYKFTDGQKTS
ncbi:hypothetical protein D082_32040 [Synechocystis sp. PCC 6714]|nr:hypothetical protein D082_32040 [Synechocystis sp. PCC 6714]